MAHFAQIDENNIVINVIVISNDDIKDENGIESEEKGIALCKNLLGETTRWIQTSYNNNFRGRYAGIGFTYNNELDVFLSPKPFESWYLNTEKKNWDAPVSKPTDSDKYVWNEEMQRWLSEEEEMDRLNGLV